MSLKEVMGVSSFEQIQTGVKLELGSGEYYFKY